MNLNCLSCRSSIPRKRRGNHNNRFSSSLNAPLLLILNKNISLMGALNDDVILMAFKFFRSFITSDFGLVV